MKKIFLFFISLFVFLACDGYNTNFPPPTAEMKLQQVFPESLGKYPRKGIKAMNPNKQKAFLAVYGESDASIQLIVLASHNDANLYFKKFIVPEIDNLKNHSRGKVNGKWFGKGKGPNKELHYRWVNDKYIFAIQAKDKETFAVVVDGFSYIAKK
ncbi:MAG: hypothetical protein AAF518_25865 [Spirochaetota bacterium]